MQELIQMVMSQLGASEDGATGAVGGIMGMIKDQADPGDFAELISKVPGAEETMAKAESSAGGGGLLGAAASLLGGSGGGALDLVGILSKAGIDADEAGPLMGMVLNFLKGKAGDGIVGKILQGAPQLAKLVG